MNCNEDYMFQLSVLFSNEALFRVNGEFNKHNHRY